jgi:hypothetical protein
MMLASAPQPFVYSIEGKANRDDQATLDARRSEATD